MSTPIYVIGSSNTDMVVRTSRLPAPGETLLGGRFLMNPGGKGANQAVAAARLGGKVSFMTRLGKDLFGRQAFSQFENENIDTRFIGWDDTEPSGVALINVDEFGENCIAVAPGANNTLLPEHLKDFFDNLQDPAYLLVQFEIPIPSIEYIVRQCGERNIPLIVNPAPAAKLKEDIWRFVYLITPNQREAEYLSGIAIRDDKTTLQATNALHSKGVENVIITLGKKGAYWSDGHRNGWVRSPAVKSIDTTAAGDCFNGALAVALAEGEILEQAVAFACVAASLSVTRMGAQSSMPDRVEVNQLRKQLS